MTSKRCEYALVALLLLQGCSTSTQSVAKFGIGDLSSYRLSGAESVCAFGVYPSDQVSIFVNVDVDGNVRNAKILNDWFNLGAGAALAAARAWKFRPLTFEGKSIEGVGKITIEFRACEMSPDASVLFPTAAPEDIEVTLQRSACYGGCPHYEVTVSGEGKVRFSTDDVVFPRDEAEVHRLFNGSGVLWLGTHDAQVNPQAVAALIEKFRAAHFMGMKPEYIADGTDVPTYVLTLRIGNTTKRVVDFDGSQIGMPASVTALQDEVDQLAGTDRWIRGNAEMVASLKAQGFNFMSRDGVELIQAAIEANNDYSDWSDFNEFIQAAMAAGLEQIPH